MRVGQDGTTTKKKNVSKDLRRKGRVCTCRLVLFGTRFAFSFIEFCEDFEHFCFPSHQFLVCFFVFLRCFFLWKSLVFQRPLRADNEHSFFCFLKSFFCIIVAWKLEANVPTVVVCFSFAFKRLFSSLSLLSLSRARSLSLPLDSLLLRRVCLAVAGSVVTSAVEFGIWNGRVWVTKKRGFFRLWNLASFLTTSWLFGLRLVKPQAKAENIQTWRRRTWFAPEEE